MKVYEVLYNEMTEESSYATISLHKTRQGARNALAKHIRKEKEAQDKIYRNEGRPSRMTFYYFQCLWHIRWDIVETEVLE